MNKFLTEEEYQACPRCSFLCADLRDVSITRTMPVLYIACTCDGMNQQWKYFASGILREFVKALGRFRRYFKNWVFDTDS